jgi:hypothetical protein
MPRVRACRSAVSALAAVKRLSWGPPVAISIEELRKPMNPWFPDFMDGNCNAAAAAE